MKRDWKPASDVRGPHVYLTISDDVRVLRRDYARDTYMYQVAEWDALTGQWVPVRTDEPVHNGTLAIAAAKRYARGLGQKTAAVR